MFHIDDFDIVPVDETVKGAATPDDGGLDSWDIEEQEVRDKLYSMNEVLEDLLKRNQNEDALKITDAMIKVDNIISSNEYNIEGIRDELMIRLSKN